MRTLLFAALLALAAPAPAPAQDDVEGVSQESEAQAETLRQLQAAIQRDPRVADSLAARIQRSKLAAKITGAQDPGMQLEDIRKWISQDPASAAQLAVGLSQDDAEGSHRFESAMDRKVKSHLEMNPDSRKGIYGRLKKSGVDSKLIKKESGEEMSEEEKRELIKDMFEGKGGMTSQVVNQAEDGKAPDPNASVAGGRGLPPNYFDRLGQGNLRGYSPQLLAIQSWLNGHGAPGAPRLIETGKLDYATLSYPAHAMRFDVNNLEKRLRLQQNYELARQLGLDLRPDQLLDPKVEADLKAKAGAAKLNARFARRRAALAKAQAALSDFNAAALLAQDPAQISRALLQSLGGKQKEAARWITVASLEEELQRLEEQEGFLSAELRALIDACPAAEAVKAAYKRRGEGYQKNLQKIKDNDEAAIKALESDGWLAAIAGVEDLLAGNSALRKDLFRNIKDFVNTPYRLRSLYEAQARWREYLDNAAKRYFSSTAYAKALLRRDAQRALLKDVFSKIASGDLDAAHTILASY
ncbi:MAG: hypothetical protein AAB320_01230 [Elusimicrobiota bacterium]